MKKYYKCDNIKFNVMKEDDIIPTMKLKFKEVKFGVGWPKGKDKFSEEFKEYLIHKYGENDWWNSKDKLTRVYYQTNEKRMVLPINKYQFALSDIIGMTVYTHHFASRKTLKDTGLYGIMGELCWEEIKEKVNKIWNEKHK